MNLMYSIANIQALSLDFNFTIGFNSIAKTIVLALTFENVLAKNKTLLFHSHSLNHSSATTKLNITPTKNTLNHTRRYATSTSFDFH